MTAAFFDVDGTLTDTTILHPLIWWKRYNLPIWRYRMWLTGLLIRLPFYFLIDQFDRALFVQLFYRSYSGMIADQLRNWYKNHFLTTWQPMVRPKAIAQVRWHQAEKHQVVLVTGGLDFTVAPLSEWLGVDTLSAKLREQDGKFTGSLTTTPMVGEAKSESVRNYAKENNINLEMSFAYGDSISDASMLACVGHPVAVNPDIRLYRLARRKGWQIMRW